MITHVVGKEKPASSPRQCDKGCNTYQPLALFVTGGGLTKLTAARVRGSDGIDRAQDFIALGLLAPVRRGACCSHCAAVAAALCR
jgi:hypothetical protein